MSMHFLCVSISLNKADHLVKIRLCYAAIKKTTPQISVV